MDLVELNRLVTDAITVAESLPKDSPRAWMAFREVSHLEEQIARSTQPGDVEGEIARVGAVAAALRASEPLRAVQLAQTFVGEGLAADVAAKLEAMVDEANERLSALAGDLTVQPVKFALAAA